MKKWSWRIMLLLMLCSSAGRGQKKWDGAGGDDQWNNPLNWMPDGCPHSSDAVVLDHQYLSTSYSVKILDTSTITIKNLTIVSDLSRKIELIIPPQNQCAPALHLEGTGQSLVIGSYGTLINRSGASAGNSITMNGKMVIQSNGMYRHESLRGNALLVSKLSETVQYPDGAFVFDVPGTAGYIVSLSGRQFPTLIFSSQVAGRKTYNGSGNGQLMVQGNLQVKDSSTLNLSINGNTVICGDLDVKGRMTWNPSTADTVGRTLRFQGVNSRLMTPGIFQLGSHFRNINVSAGKLKLMNNLRIDSVQHTVRVQSGATLQLDNFRLSGAGEFQADSAALLILGAPMGMTDQATGNLSMRTLNIHRASMQLFDGEGDQQTGERFPAEIGSLLINKKNGDLLVSNPLLVRDSLIITQGKILTGDSTMLSFKGTVIRGSSKGFVEGPLRREGMLNGDWLFPIGDDSCFAPTYLSALSHGGWQDYILTFHAKSPPSVDSAKRFPVKKISQTAYWTIQRNVMQDTLKAEETLRLPMGELQQKGLTGSVQVVHFDTALKQWIQMPWQSGTGGFTQWVSTAPLTWKNGNYTLGEMQLLALADEHIQLNWLKSEKGICLRYRITGDRKVDSLMLEICTENDFIKKQTKMMEASPLGEWTVGTERVSGKYLRLKGWGREQTPIYSNVVFIPDQLFNNKSAYPNPAADRIHWTGKFNEEIIILLNDGRRISKRSNQEAQYSWVDIHDLPPGIHRLLLKGDNKMHWVVFCKY